MKKLLLPLLIAAGFSTAQAQSQEAPLQIYGNLNIAGVAHNAPGLNAFNMSSSVLGNSSLGFRGTHDIAGGYKASVNLETAVNTNSGNVSSSLSGVGGTNPGNGYAISGGSTSLFYRKANLEIITPTVGNFTLGRQLTPQFYMSTRLDALGIASGGIGAVNGTLTGHGSSGNRMLSGVVAPLNPDLNVSGINGGPNNYSNGIGWKSPTYNGVTVHAMWGMNQNGPTASNEFEQQGQRNVVVEYEKGPFSALVGVQDVNDNTGATQLKTQMAGAAYTYKDLTFKYGYFGARWGQCSETKSGGNCMTTPMSISASGIITAARNAPVGTAYGNDFDANALGVSYKVNDRTRVAAQYTAVVDKTVDANKVNLTSVYGQYNFSKTFAVFALYSRADNQGNANMGPIFGMTAGAPAKGQAIDAFAIGMRKAF